MIRTQIQLEPSTYAQMKTRAAAMHCSISELARQSIEEKLQRQSRADKWQESLTVLGRHGSGLGDLSENHDKYLTDGW
jgi:post-segregation antitoxin (ccd killing protein)